MRKILAVLLFFCQLSVSAQLRDDFSDGNFTQNPIWVGDANGFIVNTAQQLQSNGPAVTGTRIQLATPSEAFVGTTWEFYARLNLATSSGNYADIFLVSDSLNLKGKNSGYFVRLGGTADEVNLYRKDAGANPVIIINGRDKTLGASTNNVVRVKVTRDLNFKWSLFIDVTGTGQSYEPEGTVVDARYQSSRYFGLLLVYSSANSQRFFFDNFTITDNTPPVLTSVNRLTGRTLDVRFNELLSRSSAEQAANYLVNNGTGNPVTATLDAADKQLVHLTFGADFNAGTSTLTITNISDLYGNRPTAPLAAGFIYFPPVIANYRDVRINEVLADVSPAVGLPPVEFIELYNASNKTFNLKDWKYSDATTATGTLPAFMLPPAGYVILCRAADTTELKPYSKVLGLASFPTLNDSGDEVELFDNTGKLIDKMTYTTASYKNTQKAEGGWTLELINPNITCGSSENYTAAVHPDGGTPGRQNSVYNTTPDTTPPALVRTELVSATQIKLTFSESLDSVAARNIANYNLSNGITLAEARVQKSNYTEVLLSLSQSLLPRQVYTLEVRNIKDCPGNTLAAVSATLALPEVPATGDVVINEILFNPRSGGVDFVELVNRSPKFLDLKDWGLGNIRTDSTSDTKTITTANFLLAPQQYVVLTTQPEVVQAHYPSANKNAFLKMSSLPSYSDKEGGVLLLAPDKKVIDRFLYNEKMHFKLLDDVNGVSLERIRLYGDSSATNWHSAASTVGYATPGYKNSQYLEQTPASELFAIEPKVFTPDGDGDKDFTSITFQTAAAGFVANITIYDANGREVRKLVKNQLLSRNGMLQWDGLDANGRKAPVGPYVLLLELFNLQGQVKVYKETVVVGARF